MYQLFRYLAAMPLRKESAFTLVELIATIAIVAILVAVMVPTVGNFVRQSRETADRQTLAVLNDAINRYKMQGGDVTALTQGKPLNSLLTLLSTPITWHGVTHQFWRGANDLSTIETVASTGSGTDYRLTAVNSYDTGEGTTSPLRPPAAFGAEVQRISTSASSHSSVTIPLDGPIPSNSMAVLALSYIGSNVATVTDTQGNTWTISASDELGSSYNLFIITGDIQTPLTIADSITITYTSSSWMRDLGALFYIENAQEVLTTAYNNTWTNTPSLSANVTKAPSLGFGLIILDPATCTPSWNQIGAPQEHPDRTDRNTYFVYETFSDTGTKTLSATASSTTNVGTLWIAVY